MRANMLTLIPLAITLAGCSEKIEAQESTVERETPADLPDEAARAPVDSEISDDAVRMQSPVMLD